VPKLKVDGILSLLYYIDINLQSLFGVASSITFTTLISANTYILFSSLFYFLLNFNCKLSMDLRKTQQLYYLNVIFFQ